LGLIHELCRTHGHEHEERERIINATPADGETEAENHISLIPGLAVHSISPFAVLDGSFRSRLIRQLAEV
jgi:hypothetical protein